jgi:hypothetical protein
MASVCFSAWSLWTNYSEVTDGDMGIQLGLTRRDRPGRGEEEREERQRGRRGREREERGGEREVREGREVRERKRSRES